MSKEINDGGPAFPCVVSVNHHGRIVPIIESDARIRTTGGMTKREVFAKAALPACIQIADAFNDKCRANCSNTRIDCNDVAATCVAYADALIAALQSPK